MPHSRSRLEVRRDRRPNDVEFLRGPRIRGELGATGRSGRQSSQVVVRAVRVRPIIRRQPRPEGRRTRCARSCVIVRFEE